MKYFFMIAGFLVIPALALGFIYRSPIQDLVRESFKPTLPQEQSVDEFTKPEAKAPSPTAEPKPTVSAPNSKPPVEEELAKIPDSINLNVPFGAQAPLGNWDMPYQEACEEASMIMVHKYFEHESITSQGMDDDILKLVDWEVNKFGYYADTNAAEIASILKEYFGREAEIKYSFTKDDIVEALAQGYPVIIPVAGRDIGNPYFTSPGPVYHVLVIKGYTDGKFITNDPGTRRGKDFLYKTDTLINASHEWSFPEIHNGSPAIIIVKA